MAGRLTGALRQTADVQVSDTGFLPLVKSSHASLARLCPFLVTYHLTSSVYP